MIVGGRVYALAWPENLGKEAQTTLQKGKSLSRGGGKNNLLPKGRVLLPGKARDRQTIDVCIVVEKLALVPRKREDVAEKKSWLP